MPKTIKKKNKLNNKQASKFYFKRRLYLLDLTILLCNLIYILNFSLICKLSSVFIVSYADGKKQKKEVC